MSWDSSLPSAQSPRFSGLFPEPTLPPEETKVALPAILFLSTFVMTLAAGFLWHIQFVSQDSAQALQRILGLASNPMDLFHGLPFCITILVILLAHEMGHYLGCRYYGIKATLPYVIPAPPPLNPFGTFGAVIRIKSLFVDRRQLFDVGIAGPLGGFVFIVPALIIGLQNSKEFLLMDTPQQTWEFGEPLLFRLCTLAFFPGPPDAVISLHPIGWAAWFGLLATSLNLLPIGQLDGGHIVYAVLGPRVHRLVSHVTLGGLVGLSLLSLPTPGYLLFALLVLFLGFRHPRPRTEFLPVGKGRIAIAILGLIIFILTFMPVPIRLVEHVARL